MKNIFFAYFLFLLFILSFFVSGVVESQDGLQYLASARNIYYKHEPTAPVYEYGTEGGWKNIHMSTYIGQNGKTFSLTGLGFSVAMLPFVTLTDLFYKHYNIQPPIHFPLENDWLILLSTSFVNIFFASLLGLVILLYLREIGVKTKTALHISVLSIFTTNLFAFSKHITAHMMFTALLFTSFFFLKKYSTTMKKQFLIFFGLIYGMTIITYNNTFMLSIPVAALYYILLTKGLIKNFKTHLSNLVYLVIGITPFLVTYFWFEEFRKAGVDAYSSATFLVGWAKTRIIAVPPTLFFEGLWGQIFSPGRSVFIYSPLLLLIIIFWSKLKRKILPETIIFVALSSIYIIFYATQFMQGSPQQGFVGLWPGESSWGPRYLAPIIPFGMLLVGFIYQQISKLQKIILVIPLSLIGLYIEILGISMPYQIKYHYLDKNFFINYTEYNVYTYVNLLPRYSPIIMMTKNMYRLVKNFKQTTFPGKYNVKMYDGVNFAFDVGQERWRSIDNKGYISFDNTESSKINSVRFDFINHPISDTKEPLRLTFEINGQKIKPDVDSLKIGERKGISLNLEKVELREKGNILLIIADYKTGNIIDEDKQIAGLLNMWINDIPINKEFISVPYADQIGAQAYSAKYQYWGGEDRDPWLFWNLHTQVYERTPDFWWIKPLYYWDIPKRPFIILFLFNIAGALATGRFLLRSIKGTLR